MRLTALLLGRDPARTVVNSTGTFVTNDKKKTSRIFFLCSLLLWKKSVPAWFVHSLNNYCLLMPAPLLKSEATRANYPRPCPSGVHSQEKRLKNQPYVFKVLGGIEPRGSDNDPHQCVCPLDSAICPRVRRLVSLLSTGRFWFEWPWRQPEIPDAFRVTGLHFCASDRNSETSHYLLLPASLDDWRPAL